MNLRFGGRMCALPRRVELVERGVSGNVNGSPVLLGVEVQRVPKSSLYW